MKLRERVLFATAALLYSGPLYAGLAGFGFSAIPLFAVLFMIWLAIVRPGDWPRDREEWRTPRALAWPLLIFSVQMVLVAFCLAVGRAIGGMVDITPPLPLAFTFLVSFLAIALARTLQEADAPKRVHVPGREFGIGAGILDVSRPPIPGRRDPTSYAQAALSLAVDLGPCGASAEAMEPVLDRIEKAGMALPVLDALAAEPSTITVMEMQARLALRPRVALAILGEGRIGAAATRALMSRDEALIEETSAALHKILGRLRGVSEPLPAPQRLRAEADAMDHTAPVTSGALRAVADDLESIRAT